MSDGTRVTLAGLEISDPPERWAALGFGIDDDGRMVATGTPATLGIAPPGRGIVGWELSGLAVDGEIDGLATRRVLPRRHDAAPIVNPNGADAVDHVVLSTPDLDRLAAILQARGLGLTRRSEIRGRRMGFRRLGRTILEVVEAPAAPATAFWGVTFAVTTPDQLDALAAANRFVGAPRGAVQPGRRIATVSRDAGLSTAVAFIDPELSSESSLHPRYTSRV